MKLPGTDHRFHTVSYFRIRRTFSKNKVLPRDLTVWGSSYVPFPAKGKQGIPIWSQSRHAFNSASCKNVGQRQCLPKKLISRCRGRHGTDHKLPKLQQLPVKWSKADHGSLELTCESQAGLGPPPREGGVCVLPDGAFLCWGLGPVRNSAMWTGGSGPCCRVDPQRGCRRGQPWAGPRCLSDRTHTKILDA